VGSVATRHVYGLVAGGQLLMAANPESNRLLLYPVSEVDAALVVDPCAAAGEGDDAIWRH